MPTAAMDISNGISATIGEYDAPDNPPNAISAENNAAETRPYTVTSHTMKSCGSNASSP